MENGKDIARWQIICGEYAGPERRATDILYGEMAPYAPIPRILVANVAATVLHPIGVKHKSGVFGIHALGEDVHDQFAVQFCEFKMMIVIAEIQSFLT